MDDQIILDKIDVSKNDDEKVYLISLLENENVKANAIMQYINDDNLKLQLCKTLYNETLKSDIYLKLVKNENIIDALILEIEKLKNVLYALIILDKIPYLGNCSKKINAVCNILKRDNLPLKSVNDIKSKMKKIVHASFANYQIQKNSYSYKNFLFSLDDDFSILNTISLLNIHESKRKDLYSLIKDDKLRDLALLMISSKEKLLGEFKPDNITNIGIPKDISIGIELEAEGLMATAFCDTSFFNRWRSKDDFSLCFGVEVVSPILYDDLSDIEDLYIITSLMKKCELKTTDNCAGHIHLGANYLDTKECFENFWLLWLTNEQIIYQICNPSGKHFRSKIDIYASPITSIYETNNKDLLLQKIKNCKTRDEIVKILKYYQSNGHYLGLNLDNINHYEKDTIEFRLSEGTLDFEEIKNNIRLYGRLFQRSKEMSIN